MTHPLEMESKKLPLATDHPLAHDLFSKTTVPDLRVVWTAADRSGCDIDALNDKLVNLYDSVSSSPVPLDVRTAHECGLCDFPLGLGR